MAYGSSDYNHLTIRALTIQISSQGWKRQTFHVTNGLCTYLFLPQNVVHHESKSHDARINVYFKSYKEAAKAVSDVIQLHKKHDKLQQWRRLLPGWAASEDGEDHRLPTFHCKVNRFIFYQ